METYWGRTDALASLKCALELQAAGVPFVLLPVGSVIDGVESWAGGVLGDFTFRRAFSRWYWCVHGPMPLDAAEHIYLDPRGRYHVRAGGHGGARHPRKEVTWHAPDGRKILIDPGGKQRAEWIEIVKRNPDMAGADSVWCDDLAEIAGARGFVELYHVDTHDGLRLIADTIKSLASTTMMTPDVLPLS